MPRLLPSVRFSAAFVQGAFESFIVMFAGRLGLEWEDIGSNDDWKMSRSCRVLVAYRFLNAVPEKDENS